MFKRLIAAVGTIAAIALASGAAGAGAAPGTVVDFGDCAFNNNGLATAPAGMPITLTDFGAGAFGNFGTAQAGFVKETPATATVAVTGGSTTTITMSALPPQFVGDPFFAWFSFLPDLQLDPLASNGSVLVTIDTTNRLPVEDVFPQQKGPAPHFGPFHFGPGTDEESCLITAS